MAKPKTTPNEAHEALRHLMSVVSRLKGPKEERNGVLVSGLREGTSDAGRSIGGSKTEEADSLGPQVSLSRKEVFERAMELAMQHGGSVDTYVADIKRAIKGVNKAQTEPGH